MRLLALACPLLAPFLPAQEPYTPEVQPASGEAEAAIANFEVGEGLRLSLFAAEPLLANPVSFYVDRQGAFYVCETFRHHAGVTDNRDHMHREGWIDDELACRTVEDRVAMYAKHLGEEFADYSVEHERIRWIVDTDGDGVADRAEVFADGFNEASDGIAAGVLVDGNEVWYTCIPKLWWFSDDDRDGVADRRRVLHDGYGVHTALLGHDMHGLCFGPDGKLYFSIGDRGMDVLTQEGARIQLPDTGAVLRCNRDGSELELFATGLRNPQELVFDQWGNLFTGENNSDGGDRARWVYVVEGGDSGWRMSYQYLPDRGPWNREKLWHPHHHGQAAWIVPPIANFANGPSGLTYDTGTGLPPRYRDHFFLCDFRGGSANSGVHALQVTPKGAGFELTSHDKFLWKCLVTDVDYGVDGNLYVTDWTEGWNTTGKGRIYRIAGSVPDPRAADAEAILRRGVTALSIAELTATLRHADRRVRQLAQFELAGRGDGAVAALTETALAPDHLLARIHAVWALGQIARGDASVLQPLLSLLADGSGEIRAQAARTLGDARFADAGTALQDLLTDRSSRVRYFAALGLGKLGRSEALSATLEMIRDNADRDPFLRHAGVMALHGIAPGEKLLRHAGDAHPSVRTAVLLALRRHGSPAVARFLGDPDPHLVTEAARAIHDEPIEEAWPRLAEALTRPGELPRPVAMRAINAAFRLGGPERAIELADTASREDLDDELRAEAIAALGDWPQPSGRDRVLGSWRPLPSRPAAEARDALRPVMAPLVGSSAGEIATAAVRALEALEMEEAIPLLAAMASDVSAPHSARAAALAALDSLDYAEISELASGSCSDGERSIRREAFDILARRDPAAIVAVFDTIVARAGADEQRDVLNVLGRTDHPAVDGILVAWLQRLQRGDVAPEIHLDLVEAAGERQAVEVRRELASYENGKPDEPVARYREALLGGNEREGRRLYRDHAAATCRRCHSIDGDGGDSGPALDSVGARLTREQLLESLVDPNRNVSEGFGPVSAMPPMGPVLTKRELRDLVEYLSLQK